MHKFPNEQVNKDIYQHWLRRIPRDFKPSKESRVCSLHFQLIDFVTDSIDTNVTRKRCKGGLKKRVLKANAVPSIFPNLPKYLSSAIPPIRQENATAEKRLINENERISQQIEDLQNEDKITSLNDLQEMFLKCNTKPKNFFLHVSSHPEQLIFYSLQFSVLPVTVVTTISVSQDLSFIVYHNNIEISHKAVSSVMEFCNRILTFTDFINLLSFMNSSVSQHISPLKQAVSLVEEYICSQLLLEDVVVKRLSFLCEQLSLCDKTPNMRRYATSTLVSALMWHAYGPSCYRYILSEGCLCLPSVRTLERLSRSLNTGENNMLLYLEKRIQKLNQFERCCSLMFDEIYVFQDLQYSNGRYIGLSEDGLNNATTVLAFMIKSQSSKYQDVIALIPLHGLSLIKLRPLFFSALKLATDAGFNIIATICDNHPVNRQFLSHLCDGHICESIQHPFQASKFFLLIDPTHTIKNVFNIFQRRGVFTFPTFEANDPETHYSTANFSNIRELYALELPLQLRIAHKLTSTLLNPSNIQRSSARFATSLFHESTISGLQYYIDNDKKQWNGTLYFIRLITNLWSIVNVKSSNVGIRKRDEFKLPIVSLNDPRILLLHTYETFFVRWQQSKKPGLTHETFTAIILMCKSLRGITLHLLDYGYAYVLLGHLQSDPLEKRFGRYRQMCGANFFVSYKNILDSEKKLKLTSLLHHSKLTLEDLEIDNIAENTTFNVDTTEAKAERLADLLSLSSLDLQKNELNVAYYVAGYASASLAKKLSCVNCVQLLKYSSETFTVLLETIVDSENTSNLFNQVNRGGLIQPSDGAFILTILCYSSFSQFKTCGAMLSDFIPNENASYLFVKTVICAIRNSNYNCILQSFCILNHSILSIFSRLISCIFNIFSKKFIRDHTSLSDASSSRKIQKLQSTRL
jgi:hypothetical protein